MNTNTTSHKSITCADVQPGDVLLSYGSGVLSDLIRVIDGGDYSHASYWDGGRIVEAALKGVSVRSLEDLVELQNYVDVWRFHSDQGDVMGSVDWPPEPVSERAEWYLEKPTSYANNQLYLVGVLTLYRNINPKNFDDEILRTVLDNVYRLFKRIVAGDETKSVVCSEFVYRCFYESTDDHRYGLSITGVLSPEDIKQAAAPALAKHIDDSEMGQRLQAIGELFHEINQDMTLYPSRPGSMYRGPNPLVAAETVSPHDLQKSPNLVHMGRLSK